MAKVKVTTKRKSKNESQPTKEKEATVNSAPESGEQNFDRELVNNVDATTDSDGIKTAPELETSDLNDISSLLGQFESEPTLVETEEAEPEPGKRKRRSKKEMQAEQETQPLVIPPELVTKVLDGVSNAGIGLLDKYLAPVPLPQKALDAMLLSDEQVKLLNPGAKAFIDYLKVNDHPVAAYLGSLIAMQITNYITVRKIFADTIKEAKKNGDL